MISLPISMINDVLITQQSYILTHSIWLIWISSFCYVFLNQIHCLILQNINITLLLFHRSSSISELVGGKKNLRSPSISSMEDMMEEKSDDMSEQTIVHQSLQHSQAPHPQSDKKPSSSLGVSHIYTEFWNWQQNVIHSYTQCPCWITFMQQKTLFYPPVRK